MSHARKSSRFFENFDSNKVMLRYQISKAIFLPSTLALYILSLKKYDHNDFAVLNILFIPKFHRIDYDVWY